MLGNDDSDEDFDFDLDEVVKIATQQNVKEVEVVSNHTSKAIHSTLQSKNCVEEDWENDDDIPNLPKTVDPFPKTSSLISQRQQQRPSSVLKDKPIHQHRNTDFLNNTINSQGSTSNSLKSQQTTHDLKLHDRPEIEKGPAKFPGPAGLFQLATENKSRGKGTKPNHRNLANRDGLCCWDNALSLLKVKNSWESSKMNLQMIKKTIDPAIIYLTAPLLVVGISKIEFTPIISHEVSCVLQDPTGEVKGGILQDVITDYGKLIQVGSVLVLRRPSVLHMTPNCFVTITKKCLIGIFSSQTNEITQLRKFAKEDLITWLSEPVIYGDPVMTSAEASEVEPIEPPMTLFTSAGSALAATTMTRFGTPSIVHRGNERLTTPSNYNRMRPPINLPPPPAFNTTPRPPISTTPRPSISPSLNPIAQPIRPPSGSQFSFKSPSAVVSTPRPAPYHQPNRSSPVLNAAPSITTGPGNKSENADENFLSQFLQGVDTDSLFDDF
ncbi:uncharacterized protein LOC124198867 [Daphnia pulex]|uniref:uncharacterized protein LOC124198867 n=1 Tax=Daphnia pulex TaxID=6669 RepID=UPI001EDF83EE|nr:uncharacterized protein LOC124198867 [Daphnia pulex]XP_046450889.1 uncharacterized protein LOC124198867 [Daphnia pulex]